MNLNEKNAILEKTRDRLQKTCAKIVAKINCTKEDLRRSEEKFSRLSNADKLVESKIISYNEKRINELNYLKGSPYFVRCQVRYDKENKETSLNFGKFSFTDDLIYSWIAPASSIRFEEPGDFEYKCPDGNIEKGKLLRKDQFMIVNGEIRFLSTEGLNSPRELIYQEHFSNRKTGFVLPEIVAEMEKNQDQVIRAHHVGPFAISGPAGSGKTTLALHRVAYLVQSPDLSEIYKNNSIVVFVQDNGTKEYFSHLLPELGINDVLITTFHDWALGILELDTNYRTRLGGSEIEKDRYEVAKLKALRSAKIANCQKNNPFILLEKTYREYLDNGQRKMLKIQTADKCLDRIDLAVLLQSFIKRNGSLGAMKDSYIKMANGSFKKKRGFAQLDYSLIVIDEFQNYLPEQLEIIKGALSKKSQSILYVGDMAQQVQLGTIKNWEEISEIITNDRNVKLQKVYRNTKNILVYIRNLGYTVEIPEKLKIGNDVIETICLEKNEEIEYIRCRLKNEDFSSAGVVAKNYEYLTEFKKAFSNNDKIHVMTMLESQGVEFDIIFLVGIDKEIFNVANFEENGLREEKNRINHDLLYVALTRAISELHVLGKDKLSVIFEQNSGC